MPKVPAPGLSWAAGDRTARVSSVVARKASSEVPSAMAWLITAASRLWRAPMALISADRARSARRTAPESTAAGAGAAARVSVASCEEAADSSAVV